MNDTESSNETNRRELIDAANGWNAIKNSFEKENYALGMETIRDLYGVFLNYAVAGIACIGAYTFHQIFSEKYPVGSDITAMIFAGIFFGGCIKNSFDIRERNKLRNERIKRNDEIILGLERQIEDINGQITSQTSSTRS